MRSVRLYEGVSVYETREQAMNQALKHPDLGQFIAELGILDDSADISVEPGGARSGHRTLRVEPFDVQAVRLFDLVIAISPVTSDAN